MDSEHLTKTAGDASRLSSDSCAGLEVGSLIGGRYRIQSVLGKGGMGVVYRVEQIFVGKELALKTLNTNVMNDMSMRRFQQEAKASFSLSHPNLITVHDFGVVDEKIPFLVMDLVFGKTLAEHLKQDGVMTYEDAIPIFVQICFAMAYAHEKGVVHRDIKPSNVMLVDGAEPGAEGSVKIVDFGIAKFSQHEEGEIQSLTKTGEIFGSPLYMSPEQCMGRPIDHRSDIYSLGCVLFETLTGTPPHIGNSALSTMMHHQNQDAPTLSEASLGKKFPEALEHVLAQMLKKDPDQRYQKMGLIAVDLNAILKGGETPRISAAAISAAERQKEEPKMISLKLSHFLCLMVLCVVLPSILSASAAYFLMGLKKEPEPGSIPEVHEESTLEAVKNTPVDLLDIKKFSRQVEFSTERMRQIFRDNPTKSAVFFKHGSVKVSDFKELSTKSRLSRISMRRCQIDENGIPELARMRLAYLNFDHSNLTNRGLRLAAALPFLKSLEVKDTKITDDGLKVLPSSGIQALDLSENDHISDRGMRYVAQIPRPFYLKISKCKNLTFKTFEELAGARVYGLIFDRNQQFDDRIIPFLSKIEGLKEIDLTDTGVTADGVFALLRDSKIKKVYLKFCPRIKEYEIVTLQKEYPEVRIVREGGAFD